VGGKFPVFEVAEETTGKEDATVAVGADVENEAGTENVTAAAEGADVENEAGKENATAAEGADVENHETAAAAEAGADDGEEAANGKAKVGVVLVTPPTKKTSRSPPGPLKQQKRPAVEPPQPEYGLLKNIADILGFEPSASAAVINTTQKAPSWSLGRSKGAEVPSHMAHGPLGSAWPTPFIHSFHLCGPI
jgi:hypothetical protein